MPYVREDTRLRTLVLRKTKLGADGMRVLVGALTTNTVLTALDVAENELKTEGAKAVAELVRWVVVCACVSTCLWHVNSTCVPYLLCPFHFHFRSTYAVGRHPRISTPPSDVIPGYRRRHPRISTPPSDVTTTAPMGR